ncbi:T9SS type A sorting domain-containing protein [Flavobacterium noncentrifugens]|uniref:Conserved repeat domain-containing protein/Por secretion system C-terminal sorting domain-containing protein n=1 Tax=Flavobacterium noncentrifugens TaxID=1128970 RepID=A0A1G8VMT6_9FLAO|nr:T9SS type A sorting domain-containing protein [Flavobacterium noncentrifugens]SDJ67388.1 conserved repeat domain-containing protein/Por secretion system C-terminal sorting domain-containing protein [Flavobacterium noncentrifugens]
MKKIFSCLLLIGTMAHAQDIIEFSDPNFKTALLNHPTLVDTNGDGEIQFTEAETVLDLEVSASNISAMPEIQYFINLRNLACNGNNLATLDISMLPQLGIVFCDNNALTSLLLNHAPHAMSLFCNDNQLVTLDLSNLGIETLYCQNNALTAVNLSGITQLYESNFSNNQLTALEFPEYSISSGDILTISNNPLTSFTLRHSSLVNFVCTNTAITTLDVSHCSFYRTGVNLSNNPNLQYINLKNGVGDSCDPAIDSSCNRGWQIDNCPALKYICVDSFEEGTFFSEHVTNVPVYSPYCSFVPGGNYNTITGNVRFDANNNGCDENDLAMPYIKIRANDTTDENAAVTDHNGNYSIYTTSGNFTVAPIIERPELFNISPLSAVATFPFDNASHEITQDFCITPEGMHPDVEVVVVPLTTARPGFDAVYKIVYKNKGNQILSGSVVFNYDDSFSDFVNAVPDPSAGQIGLRAFLYNNLLPFESRQIIVTLNINSSVETPPVHSGDVLSFLASVSPIATDETPLDNNFTFNQTAVNAIDPNSKICLEGEILDSAQIGKYVHYNINFENLGTANATNIVVRDVIDSNKFSMESLQVLNSSHPLSTKVKGNVVEFIFENINLPPSSISPIGGHGNVLFKIKTKSDIPIDGTIENTANIYFDYNAPIETNEAKTTFRLLKNQQFERDSSISIHPNPAKDVVKIQSKNTIKSIALFDVQGRILQSSAENKKETSIDLSQQSKGIYFLKISTEKGSKIEKIIKE